MTTTGQRQDSPPPSTESVGGPLARLGAAMADNFNG